VPQSFFICNGIDCRSKGVIVRSPAPIIRPEERVQHVEIPGRSGDLTETEGENIYNSYKQYGRKRKRG
jgi:phage-related protein